MTTISGQSSKWKIKQYVKEATAAIMDDNETYFDMYKAMKKTTSKNKNKNGSYPSTTPADVATALPPLKLANIGNICPMAANTPANSR